MSKLLKRVCRHMETIAPLELADHSWGKILLRCILTSDNVGVLVEAPTMPGRGDQQSTVLLTIDLSAEVMDEVRKNPDIGVIMAYHPPMFRALKKFTMADPLQARLLECVARGISIYSPHTSLDAAVDGSLGSGGSDVIVKTKKDNIEHADAGMGRFLCLGESVAFDSLVDRVKAHVKLDRLRIAKSSSASKMVSTIAMCAGSGHSVLIACEPKPDVYLTGEMSHHEILAATSQGINVILTEHTNSERGYLSAKLKDRLQGMFDDEANEAAVKVVVSQADRDPITIV